MAMLVVELPREGYKTKTFLVKNIICENWCSGEVSKSAKN